MKSLIKAAFNGYEAALAKYKVAAAGPFRPSKPLPSVPTIDDPSTRSRPTRRSTGPAAPAIVPEEPNNIDSLLVSESNEKPKSRITLAADSSQAMCTSCRQPKHYGACKKPYRTAGEGVKLSKEDMAPIVKALGDLQFHIDRPRGTVKNWPNTNEHGEVVPTWSYPTDYGFLPGHVGEDGEDLDVFVGDDPNGVHGSFVKYKKDLKTPDETKFFVGLSPEEHRKMFAFFSPEWRTDDRTYPSLSDAHAAMSRFKQADFNSGFYGDRSDSPTGDVSDRPSTSPHYTSSTISDTGKSRSRPGDPAQQASTTFADFPRFRDHAVAAEPYRMSQGLIKNNEWTLGVNAAKHAATIDELQQAYRRINPLRTKTYFQPGAVNSLTAFPTHPKEIARNMGPFTLAGDRVMKTLPDLQQKMSIRQMGGQGVWDTIKNLGGTITMPAGGTSHTFGKIDDMYRAQTPAGHKGVNIVGGIHEGFERLKKQPISPYYGHLSPDVILRENNLLSRMSGEGAAETRGVYQRLREHRGGSADIADVVDRMSGGRMPFTYGETKLPRAMRKRVSNVLTGKTAAKAPMELRGPTTVPYEEQLVKKSPPVAQGTVGEQTVDRAFRSNDQMFDATSLNGAGAPAGGPAVLG